MKPTDVKDPQYYHRVVDCQWACPAHTNVPEYIRLIAQGRYTESYLLNRESNVFPGILGRTCDRPCEPACRRGRLEEKPVAICRLKRVAADNKGDLTGLLPTAPDVKNGKRVALVGCGPASLTVANDLLPLGYQVVIFEKNAETGGLMRTNIPKFRLPPRVLDEEIGAILEMGADLRIGHEVKSLKALLDPSSPYGEFDAVFIGSGAPKGKDLDVPGRAEAAPFIEIGITWLESVAFGHVESVEPSVLVIGVGNTAMDCCRTARRIGATDIKVMGRRGRKHFKASPWELEDAEEELIDIVENHAPKEFVLEGGKLMGMKFDVSEWTRGADGKETQKVLGEVFLAANRVILAIGQDASFPWIERDIGVEFDKWGMIVVDETTHMTTRPGVFVGGDAAWGPENIIWAVNHGHDAAISIHQYCQGLPVTDRPPVGMNLISQKMGLQQWSYSNDYDPVLRTKMRHVDLSARFEGLEVEVEIGFNMEEALKEVERCLNCDMETWFTDQLCIECDACIDICPVQCLMITPNGDEAELRLMVPAPALNLTQPFFASGDLPQTKRIMVKDEDVCIHCGLCAERCPTAAWDMRKFDLLQPYAGRPADTAQELARV
ncbi:MAG: 4Fe-4S dicluster domain-containing protein [Gemmatimonadetes bacterium]|nr:4Fe-4S dicluster domain-containing protein [Gemmatimonadota bacterium]